jgi:hypothetical protein
MPGPFVISNNCHVKIWLNHAGAPSGAPDFDGNCERLLPSDNKLNIWRQRFVFPPSALGIDPAGILPTGTNTSWLGIYDDVRTTLAGYWRIVDVSLQTTTVAGPLYTVNCVFIEAVLEECPCGDGGGYSISQFASDVGTLASDSSASGTDLVPVVVGGVPEQLALTTLASYVASTLPTTYPRTVQTGSGILANADVGPIVIWSAVATNLYRFNFYCCVPVSDAGAGMPSVILSYLNELGSVNQTVGTFDLTMVGSSCQGAIVFESSSPQDIAFEITGGGTYGAAEYSYYWSLEQLF